MGLVTTIAGSDSFGIPADAYPNTAVDGGQGADGDQHVGGMVEMRGLEPLTPSLQRRCSPS